MRREWCANCQARLHVGERWRWCGDCWRALAKGAASAIGAGLGAALVRWWAS